MGRNRVRPEDRRRSSHACEACKFSKKRCDSQLPCSTCEKKGLASSCNYSEGRRPRLAGHAPTSPAFHRLESGLPTKSPSTPRTAYPTPDVRESSPLITQQPRMLLSVAGEKVYVGNTAAISFLQFLRRTLRRCAGPSAFTESEQRHRMLEATLQFDSSNHFEDDIENSDKLDFIQHFQYATSGLLFLYTDETISQLLVSLDTAEVQCHGTQVFLNQIDHASLYLMIAIGARCRGNEESDLLCSARYFSQAQEMVFKDKLYNPSLSMVSNFLLMAFYMLCACRRNTALMYLGVASQAATILGLHLPELNDTLPLEVRNFRIRMCRSLQILDTLCNTILGRPSRTLSVRREDANRVIDKTSWYRMLSLNATFDSCLNIAIISQTLINQNTLDTDTAEQFLQILRGWAQGLTGELRRTIKRGSENCLSREVREVAIGNVHVACSYYFAVILVTRQFLVATISPKLSQRHPNQEGSRVDILDAAVDVSKTTQLSQICIDAAKYLVHACHDAGTANLLLGNMCILQAWVFAAGLVLGFSLLVHSDVSHPDDRVAFASSAEVLKRLSRLSPQAQRYYEILSSLHEAIDSYEAQLHRERRRASCMHLEQVFRLEMDDHGTRRSPEMPSPPTTGAPEAQTSNNSVYDPPIDSLNRFDWSQLQTAALIPDISDELGFQLLWDEYFT